MTGASMSPLQTSGRQFKGSPKFVMEDTYAPAGAGLTCGHSGVLQQSLMLHAATYL